jgi:ubiquinone/menaquinone biosynthesis C-methylase UbiE
MIDHFGLLAPLYDLLIPPPNPAALRSHLCLPAAGRLLDAGGGTGRASSPLRHLIDEVVINDASHAMLKQARSKNKLQPAQAQVERLPFADESFDRVLVVDALHHFRHQREAIGDLLRVLKPGGRLVIEEFDLQRRLVKLVAFGEKLALMRSHFLSPEQIRDMVAAYGVSAQIEVDGFITTWIIVDK